MGPQRLMNCRRNYPTQVVYDAERGVFTEASFRQPESAMPACTTFKNSSSAEAVELPIGLSETVPD